MLEEFKRKARFFINNSPSTNWEWLVLAQHFGLPTRLLDWTENPLVTLYFATHDRVQDECDGRIYAYQHLRRELDISSQYDPFKIKTIELIRPPHVDQRVLIQQSILTAEPYQIPEDKITKSDIRWWNVSTHYKPEIRRELEKIGITKAFLFPGLESLAAEIRKSLGF